MSLHDDEPRLPTRLQRDLGAVFGRGPAIPPQLDERLRAAARRPRPRSFWQRPLLVGAAAALLLGLTVGLWLLPRGAGAPWLREDFDGDGRVLVLDAFRLQLALQRGDRVPVAFDLDGDGRVDRADVDRIAARAVRVNG